MASSCQDSSRGAQAAVSRPVLLSFVGVKFLVDKGRKVLFKKLF